MQPPNLPSKNLQTLDLDIQITDLSKANLFKGNTTSTSLSLNIDTQKPQINILVNSYKITQGGSALVIFRVMDKHLKDITISNGINQFNAHPFYKEGYYISLLAWPKNNQSFNAQIHANDSAGNKSIMPIKFFIAPKTYKSSNISINDSFIDGKLSDLVEEIGERQLTSFKDKVSIFQYINEDVRHKSIKRIQESLSNLPQEKIDNFKIYPFYPLKNGAVMASFGDSRTFFYKGESISQSHHMGLDLASIKQAPIIASKEGQLVINQFVGINGNTIVLYHGLGLASLYSHLAESTVRLGEEISKGSVIAIQGKTGLAFGDHL
ncbi:MAG: M23 family metallopeptidase, partial [Helicobacter sp.]|nr:M23 family metallopeptidase [Helicobacter sp.]